MNNENRRFLILKKTALFHDTAQYAYNPHNLRHRILLYYCSSFYFKTNVIETLTNIKLYNNVSVRVVYK